jgi:glycyl-tRNA synthetase alpha chain
VAGRLHPALAAACRRSLGSLGIRLDEHDIRFEEDNWESPTLGAWGIGWQVMLDGLEITQFTYFQQCGGLDLDPVSVEITYGLERIAAFLQNVQSVYEIMWDKTLTYRDLRLEEELELSVYDFEEASPETCRTLLDTYEAEALRLLDSYRRLEGAEARHRFPLRKVYELCLKCSHLFNILDARGAISVTERVALIARIRRMACRVAEIDVARSTTVAHGEPVPAVPQIQPA